MRIKGDIYMQYKRKWEKVEKEGEIEGRKV